MVVITSRKFHQIPFSILVKWNKYVWHVIEDRTEAVITCLWCSMGCTGINTLLQTYIYINLQCKQCGIIIFKSLTKVKVKQHKKKGFITDIPVHYRQHHDLDLRPFSIKISTPATRVMGNSSANFAYFSRLSIVELAACMRRTDGLQHLIGWVRAVWENLI